MKKAILLLTSACLFFAPQIQSGNAGQGVNRKGHTIFGDLQIDAQGASGIESMSFLVTLSTVAGYAINRENVPANGRYRFTEVPNGEYEIVIEKDSMEVGRVRFLLQETRFTDIRKDIGLKLNPDKAAAGANKAVGIGKGYTRGADNGAQFEKALKAGSAKDYAGAISILRSLTATDPKDYEAWAELGTMQFMKGDQGDAEKSYQRALGEKPDYFVALLNLGKVQLARKQFEPAVETLAKAVTQEPKSADANYYLGEAYLQIKKGSKAVGYLNEALRLDPVGMADAHLRLAALYNAANMKDKAAAEYAQFLAKKPDHPDKKKMEQYVKDNKKP
jgi:tetratricopeptide (TPR) repeat protein